MNPFNPGDKALCVEPNPSDRAGDMLYEGEIYTVKTASGNLVYVDEVSGGHFYYRFKKVENVNGKVHVVEQYRRIVL